MKKERRNIKARKDSIGNVGPMPKKKGKKAKKEEWLSNVAIRPRTSGY